MLEVDSVMQGHLDHVLTTLVNETGGSIDRDQLRAVVSEAYEEIAEHARIEQFIPILTLRQARLLLQSRRFQPKERTEVLLVCGTNAGRSQVAASLMRFYAAGNVEVVSAGQDPAEETNAEVVAYLREHGVELTDYPKRLRPEYVDAADHVVFVGSNTTDVPADKDLEQWPIPHLSDLPLPELQAGVREIDARVRGFLQRIMPEVPLPPSIFVQRP